MQRVLWAKDEKINDRMRVLTAGTDPIVDSVLAEFDCLGSAAHARMLEKCGLLPSSELPVLLYALKEIFREARSGSFEIPVELEDVHTAIETRLTELCGEAGERINTARSRSDQAALDVRLYTREKLTQVLRSLICILHELDKQFGKFGSVPMPGYTHLQPAMPSSVGLWIHAWFEWGAELVRAGLGELKLMNQNPLGAGAGFGTSLPINRDLTADLLGFDRVQRSVIDVNNRRGWFEERALRVYTDISALFEKFACDVVMFTSREYGFFSLPSELTTGSSIMPQKHNYDLVELLRASASRLRACQFELQAVQSKLPSSYHRDLQYTKEPLIRAFDDIQRVLGMADLMVSGLEVHEDRLRAALYPDLYATYHANRQVLKGVPFRSAYRETAKTLKSGNFSPGDLAADFSPLAEQANSAMSLCRAELMQYEKELQLFEKICAQVADRVFG